MKCPKCGRNILDRGAIVCCAGFRRTGVMCNFAIKRAHLCKLGRGMLTDFELKELIRGNEIELHLVNKDGIPFDCFGRLEETEDCQWWNIKFRFSNNEDNRRTDRIKYYGMRISPAEIFYKDE